MLQSESEKFFSVESHRRNETEQNLLAFIEEKSQNLRQLIGKESKIRYENIEELEEMLHKDFPNLQNAIREQ